MKTPIRNSVLPAALIAGLALMLAGPATAQSFTLLYGFTDRMDGEGPSVGCVSGNLVYGTCWTNGSPLGTVWAVPTNGYTGTPPLAPLYTFTGATDGYGPSGELVLSPSGATLYGTTQFGGSGSYNNGDGTVWAISATAVTPTAPPLTPLYSFAGATDGERPIGGLTLSADGSTLYGTATAGGSYGGGTVFSLNIAAASANPNSGVGFTTLYSFTGGSDGGNPVAGLTLSADGSTLFGTTYGSYGYGDGTVFSVSIAAANANPNSGAGFTTLYGFTGGSDGANPESALTLSADGATLYGTATGGGSSGSGTVFSVNIAAANANPNSGAGFTTLYSFTGGSDGGTPVGVLALSGNTLYGTANNGGTGFGTAFGVETNGSTSSPLTPLWSFDYFFGPYPELSPSDTPNFLPDAGLILSGNTLYGTTYAQIGFFGGLFSLSLPTVTVNPATICAGNSATLTAMTSAASPSYSWSDGETTPSITVSPTATTTYTVTVTDETTGAAASASGTVTVNCATVQPGGSATVTSTSGSVGPLVSGTLTTDPSDPPSSAVTVTVVANGAASLTPTPAPLELGATAYFDVQVAGATCSATANGDQLVVTFYGSSPSAVLQYYNTSGNSCSTPAWYGDGYYTVISDPANPVVQQQVSPTEWSYTYTFDCSSCPQITDLTGTVFALGTVAPLTCSVSPPIEGMCAGSSGSFTIAGTGGTPPYTYSWTGPRSFRSTSATISPTIAGTYTATVTDSSSPIPSVSTCTATLTISPPPTAEVSGSARICNGSSTTLFASLTGNAPWNLTWSDGFAQTVATSPATRSVSPTSSTTYTVIALIGDGCAAQPRALAGRAVVTVNPPPAVTVVADPPTICAGGSAILLAHTTATPPTYLWSTGAKTASITVTPSSTMSYSVTVTDGTTGCSETGSVTVTVGQPPTVSVAGSSSTICAGSSATLTATTSAASPNYLWSTGARTAAITVTPRSTMTYSVTVTDGTTSCSETGSVTVTVNPPPACLITGPAGPLCSGSSGNVYSGPSGMASYAWSIKGNGAISGSSTAQTVNVTALRDCNASFILTLTVVDGGGCANTCSDTVFVNDTIYPILTVPRNATANLASFCPIPITAPAVLTAAACTALGTGYSVSDNCGTGSVSVCYYDTLASGNPWPAAGTYTRHFTATDACGNTLTCAQTITVNP